MQLLLFGCVFYLAVEGALLQQKPEKEGSKIIFPSTPASDGACTTTDGKPGNCLSLSKCPDLVELRNVGVLKKSMCGFEGKTPKVCCPIIIEDDEEHAITPNGLNAKESDFTFTTISPTDPTEMISEASVSPENSNRSHSGRRMDTPFPMECGRTRATFTRIVGGQESVLGAWPWMAVIFYMRRSGMTAECGGVIVTNKHVITAAHCIVSSRRGKVMRPSQLRVRLGDHDIQRTDEGAQPVDVAVESIIKINSFELRTFQNDIAILVLSSTVEFTEFIAPICIPFDVFREDDLSQRNAFVAGWGTLSYDGPASSRLQEAQVRVWESDRCKHVFRREVPITSANLCAGDGDKDACRGDSGGPLMLAHTDGRFYLIGLVSFGKKCAEPGIPGVYTRITTFLDWIERNVENTL